MTYENKNHSVRAIRLEKFMGFDDTEWIELKPITLLFGRNSTGKSAILRALLMLKQSLDSKSMYGPLVFASDDGVDIGDYQNWIHKHNSAFDAIFGFEIQADDLNEYLSWSAEYGIVSPWIRARLRFGLGSKNKLVLKEMRLEAEVKIWDDVLEEDSVRLLIIFSATRISNRSNQWFFRSDAMDERFDAGEWPAVYLASEEGFWPYLQIQQSLNKRNQESENKSFNFISKLVSELGEKVQLFLHDLEHLGPIRSEPKRFYYVPQLGESGVGKQGQNFVQTILSSDQQGTDIHTPINDMLQRAGIQAKLNVSPLDKQKILYSVELVENASESANKININLMDVGFGVSQALPVLMASLSANQRSALLIEQPELHLHPRAQASLANLFVQMVRIGGSFIIETHSEHLFLRLRRWVTEYENQRFDQLSSAEVYLKIKELAAYFIDRKDGVSKIHPLSINAKGDVEDPPDGFDDFFSDDYLEMLALARLGYSNISTWSEP